MSENLLKVFSQICEKNYVEKKLIPDATEK